MDSFENPENSFEDEMSQAPTWDISFEQPLDERRCYVEHCFFPWTITDFRRRVESKSDSCGTVLFSASNKEECYTVWQIDLKPNDLHEDFHIFLRLVTSQNTSPVFARFRWKLLDAEGNKVFPGSLHATLDIGCTVSERVMGKNIYKNNLLLLPAGELRVLCELWVYPREVEDLISSRVKPHVAKELSVLSDDMARLLETESASDLHVSTTDGVMRCHKAILSARSAVFAKLLKAMLPENITLQLPSLKTDVLQALLMYIYCGRVDLYLNHTIPNGLSEEARKHGLLQLQQHLDFVKSKNVTELKTLDVTWKIPFFSTLIQQHKTVLYCPELDTGTLFDDRWCFKLEAENSSDEVGISVIRKLSENSTHLVRFDVKVETFGRITLQTCKHLEFTKDSVQWRTEFLKKNELCSLVSYGDTLVLKCSLEITPDWKAGKYGQTPPEDSEALSPVVEFFSKHTNSSLLQLSQDLRRLFRNEAFSDASIETKIGEIRFHSYMTEVRFLTPVKILKAFLEDLDPVFVLSFFTFLYGGKIQPSRASILQMFAGCYNLRDVVKKIDEFLASCPGDSPEHQEYEQEKNDSCLPNEYIYQYNKNENT